MRIKILRPEGAREEGFVELTGIRSFFAWFAAKVAARG
jgi:hypothetical protein